MFKILNKNGFKIDIFVPDSFDDKWDIPAHSFVGEIFLDKERAIKKITKDKNIFAYIRRRILKLTKRLLNENDSKKKSIDLKNKLNWINDYHIVRFKKVINDNKYDAVVFSYVYYSKLLDFIPSGILKICSVSDFVSIQEMQQGNYKFGEVIEEEISAIRKFDKAVFISSDEMGFFSNFIDEVEFSYLPHYLSLKECKNITKDIDILFVGSDNVHNMRGVNWFLENVYPKIKDKRYDIVIAGKISAKIDQDKYGKILFLDFVEDLDLLYSRVKIAISPLKSGTGIKIKIIEAMAHHIPVVCTRNSLVGFMEKVNNGCVIADEADEFAKAINDILSDKELCAELSNQAKEQCEKYYNEEYAEKTIAKIFK